MNPNSSWNLNPMASYPAYGQPNSARRWNVPPYDDQFGYPHRSFQNGAIFQTRQFSSDEIKEVSAHEAQVQAQEQMTGSGTKGKGKGKANYDKWTNKEQSFLVDLWAEKHNRLESKDARKVWQEICDEMKLNFGIKKTVANCQRKMKYLIDKYKDAKAWNKSQTGGHIRKSVFYDKVDRVLGTRDIVTMKHVVEAGTSTASPSFPSANPPSDHDGSQPSTSRTPSPPESGTASSSISGTGSEISDGEVHLAGSSKQCQKERKRTTKRKLPTEDTGEEEALSIKKSLESIERQGEKLTAVMEGMQQNHGKQLDMMASFMGSLLEAIKDKK